MARLTDTYRLMNGEEPVNKKSITEEDHIKINMRKKASGDAGSKVTQKFIDDMKKIRNGEGLIVEQVHNTKDSINQAIMDAMSGNLLDGKEK